MAFFIYYFGALTFAVVIGELVFDLVDLIERGPRK